MWVLTLPRLEQSLPLTNSESGTEVKEEWQHKKFMRAVQDPHCLV